MLTQVITGYNFVFQTAFIIMESKDGQSLDKSVKGNRAMWNLEETGGSSSARYVKEKKYECDRCNKRFAGPSGLRQHYQIHTGQYDYWCENCRKGFTCITNYNMHLKTKHNFTSSLPMGKRKPRDGF